MLIPESTTARPGLLENAVQQLSRDPDQILIWQDAPTSDVIGQPTNALAPGILAKLSEDKRRGIFEDKARPILKELVGA